MRLFLCAAAAALALGCSGSKGAKGKDPRSNRGVTVFVTTELKGQVEPCGCTTDPLGDLARTAQLIASARAGGGSVLYLDGGSILYPELEIPEPRQAQEKLKADLLAAALGEELRIDAAALGPHDLAMGKSLALPRHAVNLAPEAGIPTAPPRVIASGGVKVGVFGAVDPAALARFDVAAADPVPAARAAVETLRAGGAEVVIALLHMPRAEAARLTREIAGIDFAVIGQGAPRDPEDVRPEPVRSGDTWLLQPSDRGQVVSRLEITVREPGGFHDAIGEDRAGTEIADLESRLLQLEGDVAKWKAAEDADPAFVASKEKELTAARARLAELRKSPLDLPDKGSWFTLSQVEIAKSLPCDPEVVAAKQAYDKAAGAANIAAAATDKPPEPATGEAGFVGMQECSSCHKKAFEMWKTTKHAAAWETLETQSKEGHLDCVYCHVTGFGEPGGSTIAVNEELRDVQCEVCHGPGSLHVEADGDGHIIRRPDEDRCVSCHNPEHSDTFQLEAYLRDVTGPGHGEKFRESLGEGPTGGELRAAGLEKAGLSIGKGCPK